MYTVGCDFGLRKSGIVVLGEDYEILTQTLIQTSSKGAERLVDIETAFDTVIRPYTDELEVFVEGYAYGAKYQRESLAELGGVMRRYFWLNKLPFWVIPPTSNKQFVTATGKASKNYMKKCTKEKWGIAFKSDDVCDAYGLARLGMTLKMVEIYNIPDVWHSLPTEEADVLEEITDHKEHYLNRNTARSKK